MGKVDFELRKSVEKLIEAMKNVSKSWKKSWMISSPINFFTKKSYSGINALLLPYLMEERGHKSNYFLTFNQVKKLGGRVKKGAKAYNIYFTQYYFHINVINTVGIGTTMNIPAFSSDEAIEKLLKKDKSLTIKEIVGKNPFVVMYKVFNADDILNIEIDSAENNNIVTVDEIDEFVFNTGAKIKFGAYNPSYSVKEDTIKLPPAKNFKTKEDYYATLFHELTHWTGAKHRLNRDIETYFGTVDYAFEELVAEIGSMFLCKNFQISTEHAQHPEYLNSWIKKLGSDPKYLYFAASRAEKAKNFLLKEAKREIREAA